jgi:predicted Zn-ribbon and HTH transcriptional regulator
MSLFHHSTPFSAEVSPIDIPREGLMQDLQLKNEALWLLLKENTDLTEEDVHLKMEEIRNSGIGYRPADVHKCPECKAEVPWNGTHCQFCGYKLTSEDMAEQECAANEE